MARSGAFATFSHFTGPLGDRPIRAFYRFFPFAHPRLKRIKKIFKHFLNGV